MGKRMGAYRVMVGKPEGKRSFVKPSIQGRITLKLIFKKYVGRECTDLAPDRNT
jgi:hypothetical protein